MYRLRNGHIRLRKHVYVDRSRVCSFALLQVGWRPEDLEAVVKSPRNVAYVEDVTRKLEQGDLKLRVSQGLRYYIK